MVLIGLVILAGIVVNNAIVLVDAVNQLRGRRAARSRGPVDAGLRRHAADPDDHAAPRCSGLLPMALGFGEGAELRAPLAITVIGGPAVATLLTLVVIPVVYALVERRTDPVPADPARRRPAPRQALA